MIFNKTKGASNNISKGMICFLVISYIVSIFFFPLYAIFSTYVNWLTKFFHLINLSLFALILCIAIILARRRIKLLEKRRQTKPSSKYIAARSKANQYFNKNFGEILMIARRLNKQHLCPRNTYRRSRDDISVVQLIDGVCSVAGEKMCSNEETFCSFADENMTSTEETYESLLQTKIQNMYESLV